MRFPSGNSGDDETERIQQRLYELGYLATADLVTGNFGDSTEAAVLKLQEVNGLEQDGKVGQRTINLLYSDEIKPNSFLTVRRAMWSWPARSVLRNWDI